MEISDKLMENLCTYMNDELREDLHGTMAPCGNMEFLLAYVANDDDPEFKEILETEFTEIARYLFGPKG